MLRPPQQLMAPESSWRLLDQAKNEGVRQLSNEVWRTCHGRYHITMGGPPPQREEVAREQLAAFHPLFTSTRPPNAESVVRQRRRMKIEGLVLGSPRILQPTSLLGAGAFDDREESFVVFRTESVMPNQTGLANVRSLRLYGTCAQLSTRHRVCASSGFARRSQNRRPRRAVDFCYTWLVDEDKLWNIELRSQVNKCLLVWCACNKSLARRYWCK